jgi:hypothetical protein
MDDPDGLVLQRSFRVHERPAANPPMLPDSTARIAEGAVLLIDCRRFQRELLLLMLASEMPRFEVIAAAALETVSPNQMARADIIVINALPEASIVRICAAMSSKPVLWLCEDIDGDLRQYNNFDIFPARCGGALLAAALQLIAAGGRFLAPRKVDNHSALRRPEKGSLYDSHSRTA